MAGTIRTGRSGHFPRLTLNSDGRSHPMLNIASVFTLMCGLLSFALGLFLRTGPSGSKGWAVIAAATGLAALLIGLFTQMMSATREERIVTVTGIIAGFVGLCLGLAFGGFG
jgi:FtsH-binding integral membrane protein